MSDGGGLKGFTMITNDPPSELRIMRRRGRGGGEEGRGGGRIDRSERWREEVKTT